MISDYSLPCVSLKSFTSSRVTICLINFSDFPVWLMAMQFIKLDLFPSQCRHIEILFSSSVRQRLPSVLWLPCPPPLLHLSLDWSTNSITLKPKTQTIDRSLQLHLDQPQSLWVTIVFQTTEFNPYFTWFNRQKADPITKRLNQPGFFNHTIMN